MAVLGVSFCVLDIVPRYVMLALPSVSIIHLMNGLSKNRRETILTIMESIETGGKIIVGDLHYSREGRRKKAGREN